MKTIAPWLLVVWLLTPVCFLSAQTDEISDRETRLAHIDSLRSQRRIRDALATIEEHLPAARADADSSFLLGLTLRKGYLLSAYGQSQPSFPVLDEAINLARVLKDTLGVLEGLRWQGFATANVGNNKQARQIYDQLYSLAEVHRSPQYQAWSRVGTAWQNYYVGRNTDSARCYREAIALFESGPPGPGLAWTWNGLGTATSSLGEYTEALICYEKAADIAHGSGNTYVESMALNNRGTLAYSLGDPGTALEQFRQAADLQKRLGYFEGSFQPLLNIALCYVRLGRYDDAEAGVDTLLAECRNRNLIGKEGVVLRLKADIRIAQGHTQQAIALLRQVLNLGAKVQLKTRIEARIALASYLHETTRTSEAVTILRDGEDELTDHGLFSQELVLKGALGDLLLSLGHYREGLDRLLAAASEAKARGLPQLCINPLVSAAGAYRALDLPDSSLIMLQEAVKAWEANRDIPLDPEWRETLGESGRLLYTELATQLLEPDPVVPEAERTRRAFEQMQVFKTRTLLERMLGPGSVTSDSTETLPALSLDQVQSDVLLDGELLLDFYVGPNTSLVFAVTRSEWRVTTLPGLNPTFRKLTRYFSFLAKPPKSGGITTDLEIVQAAGSQLYSMLFDDLEDLLTSADLIFFAPDDIFNLLSPETMLDNCAECTENLARIPSANVLKYLRANAHSRTNERAGRILALAGGREPGGNILTGARQEAEMLARSFKHVDLRIPTTTNAAEADTNTSFGTGDLVSYELLHLAAHASVDNQSPWNSSIRVCHSLDGDQLTAASIATTRLDARLAVLAACESGGGRILSGEGLLGLTSAFISAGVPAVVATLWPVDDASTAVFMKHFYAGLAAGQTTARALRMARTVIRNNPATEHPFFWAGYILVGDGQIQIELERRLPLQRIIMLILAVVAICLLLYSFRRVR